MNISFIKYMLYFLMKYFFFGISISSFNEINVGKNKKFNYYCVYFKK